MQNKTLNEYLEQLKIYVQQSNYIDSIDLLKNAISQYPEENKLKLNLGNIYKLLDQNDDAANIFSTLKNSELADLANNNLSIIYLEQQGARVWIMLFLHDSSQGQTSLGFHPSHIDL